MDILVVVVEQMEATDMRYNFIDWLTKREMVAEADELPLGRGHGLNIFCSQVSALCVTLVTAPTDMLKTRQMGGRVGASVCLFCQDCFAKMGEWQPAGVSSMSRRGA